MALTYTERLSWLGGIIDGEGCITLWLNQESGRHLCRVSIGNKDEGILEECRGVLKDLDIIFWEYKDKRCKGFVHLEIGRALEAKFLLEKLMPYMRSYKNRKKAIKFIQWIESSGYDKLGRKINRRKRRC